MESLSRDFRGIIFGTVGSRIAIAMTPLLLNNSNKKKKAPILYCVTIVTLFAKWDARLRE